MAAMMGARKKMVVEVASTVHTPAADEPGWIKQQKRAFAGWVNLKLSERGLHVESDITTAFQDGLNLIALAEILCEDRCPKHTAKPKFRVHKIENASLGLNLLQAHGFRSDASNENLVDGDPKLTLGFIYQLFVRFVGGEQRDGGMDGLLQWVQSLVNTGAYGALNVQDFAGSWSSGLAVCALLHALSADYVDFSAAAAGSAKAAHETGYEAAKQRLGVPRLLDPDEMVADTPDDKAVRMHVMLIKVAHERAVKAAAARAEFKAGLRQRLEAMPTDALWRLYDGTRYEGDCPNCNADLRRFFEVLLGQAPV